MAGRNLSPHPLQRAQTTQAAPAAIGGGGRELAHLVGNGVDVGVLVAVGVAAAVLVGVCDGVGECDGVRCRRRWARVVEAAGLYVCVQMRGLVVRARGRGHVRWRSPPLAPTRTPSIAPRTDGDECVPVLDGVVVGDAVADGDDEGDDVPDMDDVGDADDDCELDGDVVAECEPLGDADAVCDEVVDWDDDVDAEGDPEADLDDVASADAAADALTEDDDVAVDAAVSCAVPVLVALGDLVADGDCEAERVADGDGDSVGDDDVDGEADGDDDADGVCVSAAVRDGVCVSGAECVGVEVAAGVRVATGVPVTAAVVDGVPVAAAVCVLDGVPDVDAEDDGDAELCAGKGRSEGQGVGCGRWAATRGVWPWGETAGAARDPPALRDPPGAFMCCIPPATGICPSLRGNARGRGGRVRHRGRD